VEDLYTRLQTDVRRIRRRSLGCKFALFTAFLATSFVLIIIGLDTQLELLGLFRGLVVGCVVVSICVVLSRFAIRSLTRPLSLLQAGINSVRQGRLEPIPVSRSGDEIEALGDSINQMITALAESRAEVHRNSELLEERIRQRTEELETAVRRSLAASQAKSEFLANVSHELRTPLNGVIGMIGMVLDSRLTPEQREQLETAHHCAHSLLCVVSDILDLSKIEAGKLVLDKVPFDVCKLLDDCAGAQRANAASKSIALEYAVDPRLQTQLIGDPLRIRQIVSNLLSNAVKFTNKGGVRMEASGEAAGDKAFELRIQVSDTGIGIAAGRLPFIFEKFTQGDSSITRRFGGTGLGLAITRSLVEAHGGDIHVESKEGHGSTFSVCLMCEHAAAAAQSSENLRERRARVLVVEDNLVNQRVVMAMLRKAGYEPVVANDGQEALDVLRDAPANEPFAAVLMDVQMPVLDGFAATRAIRMNQRWTNLPVIAMTAHAMSGYRDRCLQAGMNAFLSKPVNPALLISTVERYLRPDSGRQAADAGDLPKPAGVRMGNDAGGVGAGMVELFLQLAPERLQRLSAAADRGDTAKLVAEAEKFATAAQRIGAAGVSDCTRRITGAASVGDYDRVHQELASLSDQISFLNDHASSVNRPRPAELAER
jgi:signal transduction histidine kinase/CheY-like chemotaxis protein